MNKFCREVSEISYKLHDAAKMERGKADMSQKNKVYAKFFNVLREFRLVWDWRLETTSEGSPRKLNRQRNVWCRLNDAISLEPFSLRHLPPG